MRLSILTFTLLSATGCTLHTSVPPLPPSFLKVSAFTPETPETNSLHSVESPNTDLFLSYPELIPTPPNQHFVAYGSVGNEIFKYNSNGCQQVKFSYKSPVTCAIYFKQTPEPGLNTFTGPSVQLSWDASPDTNVVGYAIYAGTNTGNHYLRHDAGLTYTTRITNLTSTTWYFVATAYTAEELESLPSNEVFGDLPLVATGSVLIFPDYIRISPALPPGTNNVTLPLVMTDSGFFQLRTFQ